MLPLESVASYIRAWGERKRVSGFFCRDTGGAGRMARYLGVRFIQRCGWATSGALYLNNWTQVVCIGQKCTDWLEVWLAKTGFMAVVQATYVLGDRGGVRWWVVPRDPSRTHPRPSFRMHTAVFPADVEWACLSPT